MSESNVTVEWNRSGATFTDNRYSRGHTWRFDGGVVVPASSSPDIVRLPFSVAENVDPEEAFVASLSSCHMLSFLYVAAQAGFLVETYVDRAAGFLTKNSDGKLFMSRVVLQPEITFSGSKPPDDDGVHELHERAHAECFLANSVRTDISVDGSWSYIEAAKA